MLSCAKQADVSAVHTKLVDQCDGISYRLSWLKDTRCACDDISQLRRCFLAIEGVMAITDLTGDAATEEANLDGILETFDAAFEVLKAVHRMVQAAYLRRWSPKLVQRSGKLPTAINVGGMLSLLCCVSGSLATIGLARYRWLQFSILAAGWFALQPEWTRAEDDELASALSVMHTLQLKHIRLQEAIANDICPLCRDPLGRTVACPIFSNPDRADKPELRGKWCRHAFHPSCLDDQFEANMFSCSLCSAQATTYVLYNIPSVEE